MKCYFDPDKEAQGQCQQCGRFASRYYSKIVEGRFICVACFYDNKPIYDIVVGLIEEGKSVEVCGKCQRPVFYDWPSDDESRMLKNTLTWDEKRYIENYYPRSFTSRCPNNCYYCEEHKVKEINSLRDGLTYRAEYECVVCSKTWTIGGEIRLNYD